MTLSEHETYINAINEVETDVMDDDVATKSEEQYMQNCLFLHC